MISEIREHIPEGNTIIFEAPQRWGKTLSLVIWALDAYQKDRPVFTNIQLGFPHERLEFNDVKLADGKSRFFGGHIAIDELNFFFDARRSMKGSNLEFSAFLLQQKKQGCNLTGTTHSLDSLDVRLRENYDYVIRPRVFPAFPAVPEILQMRIMNGPLQARKNVTLRINCKPYLNLYDTLAVYDPFKADENDDEKPRARPKRRLDLSDTSP